MVNYSNGKIYKIVCDTTGLIYVGSTTKQYLSNRISEHRAEYRYWKEGNGRCSSSAFKVLEADNYSIVLLESVDCKTKDELCTRERHYIETLKCVNKVIPSRKDKERNQDNKEKRAERDKVYRKANKEHISEVCKKYKETHKEQLQQRCNCECGGDFAFRNKSTHLKSLKHMNYIKIPPPIINVSDNGLFIYTSEKVGSGNKTVHSKE